MLAKGLRIYTNILAYTHANFSLAILVDLGPTGSVPIEVLLAAEQEYLDTLFAGDLQNVLNSAPIAGSTLGFK